MPSGDRSGRSCTKIDWEAPIPEIRPYLPPLTDDAQLPGLQTAGEWEDEPVATYLERLASALEAQRTNVNLSEVVSIPDVWAQPLVFTAAWSDEKHSLHAQAQAEWRGLLAVVALSRYLGLGVRMVPIDLEELSRNPWHSEGETADQGASDNTPNIMRILAKYAPGIVLHDGLGWKQVAVIACNDKPLGLIIPSTLVCPARGYLNALPASVYWRRGGDHDHLTDPCESSQVSWGECRALSEYLNHVIQELVPNLDTAQRLAGQMKAALTSYRNDADRLASRLQRNTWKGTFSFSELNPPSTKSRPYQFLAQSVSLDVAASTSGESAPSETVLKAREGLENALRGAVLADEDLATELNLKPQEIRIWGAYSLAQALRDPGTLDRVRSSAGEHGYAVLHAADLFSDNIFKIAGGQAAAHPDSAKDFLLPLKPQALLFLGPEDLKSRLTVSEAAEKVDVTLKLPLSSADGRKHEVTVRKSYPSGRVQQIEPPVLATWPDFSSVYWKHHIAFYSGEPKKENFVPVQAISLKILVASLSGYRSSAEVVERVMHLDLFEESKRTELLGFPTEHYPASGIIWSDHNPEALVCKTVGTSLEGGRPVGLLLLERLPEISPRRDDDRWKIGIDFGTTNTSVYFAECKDGEINPRSIPFQPRIKSPLVLPDDVLGRLLVRDELLSVDDEISVPFLSVLQDRGFDSSRQWRPFYTRHVRYVRRVIGALERLRSRVGSRGLHFDLKWSDDAHNRRRVEDYLTQIALQSLAEIVILGINPERIDWYFSYPGSFLSKKIESFKDIYVQAIASARGLQHPGEGTIEKPQTRLEGESAARYFRHLEPITFGQNVITIDVGGQTSDICIWSERRLVWQTSQHLAGQHIVIDYLANHLEFFDKLEYSEGDIGNIKEKLKEFGSDHENIHHALEIFVNSDIYKNIYEQNIRHIREEGNFAGLLKVAEFCFVGLIHYLAIVSRHLNEHKHLPPEMSDLHLCLGGRGSLIFQEVEKSETETNLQTLFTEVSGIDVDRVSLHFSKKPKHEVAYGLMIPPSGADDLDTSSPYEAAVIGEQLIIAGKARNPTDKLVPEDVDAKWETRALPEFERFIENYERVFNRTVPFAEFKTNLIARLDNAAEDMRHGLKENNSQAESHLHQAGAMFITALREFVQMLNENGEAIQ